MTDTERAARRFYAVLVSGDESLIEQTLDPDWQQIPLAAHASPGPEGYRELIRMLRQSFSDLTIEVDDVMVDRDRVAVRATARARHTGTPVFGVPASGRAVEYRSADFHRIHDGRVVRSWHLEDFFGLSQQLAEEPARTDPEIRR